MRDFYRELRQIHKPIPEDCRIRSTPFCTVVEGMLLDAKLKVAPFTNLCLRQLMFWFGDVIHHRADFENMLSILMHYDRRE